MKLTSNCKFVLLFIEMMQKVYISLEKKFWLKNEIFIDFVNFGVF
jgi:hypothetical protein